MSTRPRHWSTGTIFTRFALETLTVGAIGWGMIYFMFACGNAPRAPQPRLDLSRLMISCSPGWLVERGVCVPDRGQCEHDCQPTPDALPITWHGNTPSCPAGYSVWVDEARTATERDAALCVRGN